MGFHQALDKIAEGRKKVAEAHQLIADGLVEAIKAVGENDEKLNQLSENMRVMQRTLDSITANKIK